MERYTEREKNIYMCVLNSTTQPDAQKSEKPGKQKLSSNLHPRTTEIGIFLEIYFTTTTKTQQKLLQKPEMSIDFRRFSEGFSSLGPCKPHAPRSGCGGRHLGSLGRHPSEGGQRCFCWGKLWDSNFLAVNIGHMTMDKNSLFVVFEVLKFFCGKHRFLVGNCRTSPTCLDRFTQAVFINVVRHPQQIHKSSPKSLLGVVWTITRYQVVPPFENVKLGWTNNSNFTMMVFVGDYVELVFMGL